MRVVLDDETLDVNLVGFEEGRKAELVFHCAIGDAVVTNHWCSEGKDLPLVGRIGQTLRVSNHTSAKDDLK